MKVNIKPATESEIDDDEMRDLLDTLVRAYGDNLPNNVSSVEASPPSDVYELHMSTGDIGRAYGELLATNGWAIVGVHTHDTDDSSIDRVSVKRIEECEGETTLIYDEGDERRVEFCTEG